MRNSSIQRLVIQNVSKQKEIIPQEAFDLWIESGNTNKKLVIHTFAHFDAKMILEPMDETNIKSHGLTDLLLLIAKGKEKGDSLQEITDSLLIHISELIELLYRYDFSLVKVKSMLNFLDSSERKQQVNKSSLCCNLFRFGISVFNRRVKVGKHYSRRQFLSKLTPKVFLIEMYLTMIIQEASILVHCLDIIFKVLALPVDHDIIVLLYAKHNELTLLFQDYDYIVEKIDYTRFNKTCSQNLDVNYSYPDGNYDQVSINLINQIKAGIELQIYK
jgi:hypothetical protein